MSTGELDGTLEILHVELLHPTATHKYKAGRIEQLRCLIRKVTVPGRHNQVSVRVARNSTPQYELAPAQP